MDSQIQTYLVDNKIPKVENFSKMSDPNKNFQVFVKSLNGKSYVINVKPTDKVETFIKLAAEKTNSNLEQMRLLFASKDLGDEKTKKLTIEQVGIQNNSNTFIIYRLKGGCNYQ